eukprot:TRINITY_DN19976_c2_g1_i4.p1 TRINITY_DN19976_c2_g1~~TRINITY_DN19976_c2_g1_i4.p1  ORF type:complete len:526 (+),score=46.63 TRINITY_DN19976_c2_g1_i4:135-1712(+)
MTSITVATCLHSLPGGPPDGYPTFFSSLSKLVLHGCDADNVSLQLLARLTGSLEELFVSRFDLSASSDSDHCPDERVDDIEKEAFCELLQCNHKTLRTVVFGDDDVDAFWRDVEGSLLGPESLELTLRLENLTILNISDSPMALEDFVEEDPHRLVRCLSSCLALRELRACRSGLRSFDLSSGPPAQGAFPQLEVLRLDHNQELPVVHIREIFRRLSTGALKLKELGLRRTIGKIARRHFFPLRKKRRRHDDSDEERAVPAASSVLFRSLSADVRLPLQVLDVSGCRLLGEDLHRLPLLLPELRDLRLGVGVGFARAWAKPYEYTDIDVALTLRELRCHCPHLQRLCISKAPASRGMDRSDSLELQNFLLSHGRQLLELHLEGNLSGVNPFHGGSFRELHQLCPNLLLLDVVNLLHAPRDILMCRDNFWQWLSRQLPHCKVHAVSGSVFLGGRSLDHFGDLEELGDPQAKKEWNKRRIYAARPIELITPEPLEPSEQPLDLASDHSGRAPMPRFAPGPFLGQRVD